MALVSYVEKATALAFTVPVLNKAISWLSEIINSLFIDYTQLADVWYCLIKVQSHVGGLLKFFHGFQAPVA